jgi:GMP synthase (glutamine-hydrolysing)
MTQNNKPTILIVDNFSPYSKDIVECVIKLGAKYSIRSGLSLANAIFTYEERESGFRTQDSHIDEEDYGCLPNGSEINKLNPRLGIDLNSNNNRSRDVGHADDFCNAGKLFVDKVILSGRRANDPKLNAINSQIIKQCLKGDVPLLGICYGAEILALTLGGSIKRMPKAVQENVPITVSRSSPLISDDARPVFYESHKYCVSRLPEGFDSLASSIYCEHEIFSFKRLFGTQFHPEKSGPDGYNLLSKFVNM